MRVLKLDKAGTPEKWISREDAAVAYAKDQVLWELGNSEAMFGGMNRNLGIQSHIDIAPIIACDSLSKLRDKTTFRLSNAALFKRDNFQCMYCGRHFNRGNLTRDHITPRVQGGPDIWENVITACVRCNTHKGGRTPEEANMELLAIPFAPNLFEFMYLKSHKILADQMEFLSSKFSGQRVWQ
tara:strand:+ start:89056 stop:89604 length:549 start_codon:yes stop_codon:yes gene_type:complete